MDGKAAARAIVARMRKPKEGGEAEPSDSAEVVAARELIAAIKDGDEKAASEALKAHYEACYPEE